MGKKRSAQNHVQQSMGQMVSKAALSQMGPEIEHMVRQYSQQMANQIAEQSASTIETLFQRLVVLEQLLAEKGTTTAEDLTNRVADLQDKTEGLTKVETVEAGDTVRIEVSSRTKDQTEYQGTSRMKVSDTGLGRTIGKELESALIGMKVGETKEVTFGGEGSMVAKMTVDRVSRPIIQQEAANANQAQG